MTKHSNGKYSALYIVADQYVMNRDIPGGPVVKTSCNAGSGSSIPAGEAKIPHAAISKNQNRRNTVTNSTETLKMVHTKKKKKKS